MINTPEIRPEEFYNKEKILSFLEKNQEMRVIWTRITNNPDLKKRLEPKSIRDFLIDVRHGLRDQKQKAEKAKFDDIYNKLAGDKKYINGFKKLIGHLLHIFETEENPIKKIKNETEEICEALENVLGLNTEEIYKAFEEETNEEIRGGGISQYEAQIQAYRSIKKRYNKVQDIPEDQLLDILIRRYNISRKT